jgi:hypothetical protein
VAAAATPGERGRRASLVAPLLLAVAVSGCAAQPATPTAAPQPSTVPLAATTTLAPATTEPVPASGPLTSQERAWLKAITRLDHQLEDVVIDGTFADSPATLRKLASQLRGCRGALARLGLPSQRLQPAHRLAAKACTQAAGAAHCFTTAANLGIPVAGSATEHKLDQAIECALEAATDAGISFVEAEEAAQASQGPPGG